jgi:general stress protein YciG
MNKEDKPKSKRGFASMDPKKLEEIARKGGYKVSEDRKHMAEIGRKGGERKRK